jgi:hypothetical protein
MIIPANSALILMTAPASIVRSLRRSARFLEKAGTRDY